jgi:hypothetical protein
MVKHISNPVRKVNRDKTKEDKEADTKNVTNIIIIENTKLIIDLNINMLHKIRLPL